MKATLLVITMLFFNTIQAQNFDALMTEQHTTCADVTHNSTKLYAKYYSENKTDSLIGLLKYWENKCGITEPIMRGKILTAITNKQYHDSLLSPEIIALIFNYKYRTEMQESGDYSYYNYNEQFYGYIHPDHKFDSITKSQANELILRTKPGSMEQLLCEFYSGETAPIFRKIQNTNYQNSFLFQKHQEEVSRYKDLTDWHSTWILGTWIPTGALKKMGIHPSIGRQFGVKKGKINYNVSLNVKFLKAKNKYYALEENTSEPELTDNFFGVHAGFDVERDLLIGSKNELQLLGGFGFESIETLEGNTSESNQDEQEDHNSTIETYNLNIGLGYKYYYNSSHYLGINLKYNVVDYALNHVIDFSGNPITVQFIIGNLGNPYKKRKLEQLSYSRKR